MPRNSKAAVLQRCQQIQELVASGVTSSLAIAERLGVTERQVRRDIRSMDDEWRASLAEKRGLWQMNLVQDAAADNRELLVEWERSKKDKTASKQKAKQQPASVNAKGKPVPASTLTEAEQTTEGRLGDAALMRVRAENRKFIAETLGLQEPRKTEIANADGKPLVVKVIAGGASMDDL